MPFAALQASVEKGNGDFTSPAAVSLPGATFQHKSCHSAAHTEGEVPGTGRSFGSDG